jgi:hypothetical protein
LRLCVKKKKNLSQRRGDAKIKTPLRPAYRRQALLLCAFARTYFFSKNQSEIPSSSLSSNQDNSSSSNSPSIT